MWLLQLGTLAAALLAIGVGAEWFVSGSRRRLGQLRRHAEVLGLLPDGPTKDAFGTQVEELAQDHLARLETDRPYWHQVLMPVGVMTWIGAATLTLWRVVSDSRPPWSTALVWVLLLVSVGTLATDLGLRVRRELRRRRAASAAAK